MARKTSFYYSFLVLPADQRRAIIAVWDFCRAVDDAVDNAVDDDLVNDDPVDDDLVGDDPVDDDLVDDDPVDDDLVDDDLINTAGGPVAAPPREAIAFWRAELARCYSGQPPATSQGRGLQAWIAKFQLPRSAFDDVIDGVAMDLDRTRYQTFEDLLEYCRRVASAVGLVCIRSFGCRSDKATEYALHLGIALQLTNILRDVKQDLGQGRLYLPLDDLKAAGCTEHDLARGAMVDPVRRLIAFECRRAHDFYRRALDARPADDRGRLVAAEIMRAVYFETLQRIEQNGYDVFSAPTRVPRPVQAAIALRTWLFPT